MTTTEFILLLLRFGSAAALLTFLGAIAYILWRDMQPISTSQDKVFGHLIVTQNEHATPPVGARLPLFTTTTLGRAPVNIIRLEEPFASNEHTRVVRRKGQWWVEDQHSSNGTYLNGMRIDDPVVLSPGDIIAIGSLHLRLELNGQSPLAGGDSE